MLTSKPPTLKLFILQIAVLNITNTHKFTIITLNLAVLVGFKIYFIHQKA